MKLLIVTPYFYPKIGGLENYALNIALGLKKQYKWDLVVITSNHKEKKDIVEKVKGLKVYRLAPLFKLSNTPINPLWYWKIKKIIKREKPDMINAHTPVPFIADITALVAGEIPFFVTYHALSLYKHNFTLFNVLIKAYKSFEELLFKRADSIIIVSDAIKAAIPSKFDDKVTIIYNSISKQHVPKRKPLKTLEEINMVFISSLDKSHDWKGLREILLAIKLYRDKTKKDIKLSVIGDGNYKETYKKLAKYYGLEKNVTFYGKKFGKAKEAILKRATLGIIYPKSSNDAFPTVALEYWAQSLPIIASNIMPINKITKNKKTAYLVKPKSPQLLFEALQKLATDTHLAATIANGGYQELKTKYILENEIKKIYTLTKGYFV